jgi:D-sedoheptulose 7-phosphate isomerase
LVKSSSDLESWPDYLQAATSALRALAVTRRGGEAVTPSDGFDQWLELTHEGQNGARCMYLIGNGASAMLASHFAADACKNGGLSAGTFNDPALLTATANDVAFDEVFALPLSRIARAGDLLIAISSSGNSPNILRAIETARAIGMTIITLTAKGADNRARRCGDLNFYVPAQRYGWAECAHQLLLHYWLDQYLNLYRGGAL